MQGSSPRRPAIGALFQILQLGLLITVSLACLAWLIQARSSGDALPAYPDGWPELRTVPMLIYFRSVAHGAFNQLNTW